MLVCVVQCFTCLDAVPLTAKMRVDTKTLRCDIIGISGVHCDWFWHGTKGSGILARNLNEQDGTEIQYDASTPDERQLWFRATRNL